MPINLGGGESLGHGASYYTVTSHEPTAFSFDQAVTRITKFISEIQSPTSIKGGAAAAKSL
jgi:hypothetical protein